MGRATQRALLGFGAGALKFVLGEHTRKQQEEAEVQKEMRLAAIRAQESERAFQNQRAMQEDTQAFSAEEGEKTRAQATAEAQKTRDFTHGENAENRRFQSGENAANRAHSAAQTDKQINSSSQTYVQTVADEAGRMYQIPLGPAGQAKLDELQAGGRKLQLMEGSRGGRFVGIGDDADTPRGSGIKPATGAGSAGAKPPASDFVWDPKQGKLVPSPR